LLPRCRALIHGAPSPPEPPPAPPAAPPQGESWQERVRRLTGRDPAACPVCRVGRLVCVRRLAPVPEPWQANSLPGRATSP
jgi:hypothetical protein